MQNTLLVVENTILIRYYLQTPKTRALYESMSGPAGWPSDNPPNSDGWEVSHRKYPSWRFGFIDNPDYQFSNGSVWTLTRIRSDGPEPLLPLLLVCWSVLETMSQSTREHFTSYYIYLRVSGNILQVWHTYSQLLSWSVMALTWINIMRRHWMKNVRNVQHLSPL